MKRAQQINTDTLGMFMCEFHMTTKNQLSSDEILRNPSSC